MVLGTVQKNHPIILGSIPRGLGSEGETFSGPEKDLRVLARA